MAKRSFGIFYIDANKGYFLGSNVASGLSIDIPADTMSYFDVINKDKLYQIIQTLVTANKIEPVPILIIVSPNASYEKDTPSKASADGSTDIQQFLESVPFEKVLSKSYKVGDGTKIVATNRELYEVVKHGFEKLQFSIVGIVALSLLQKVMPDIGTTLNLEVIANKFDGAKQYSFITLEEINNPNKPKKQEEGEVAKPNPMRLYGLVGLFVVLIGVLIVMVITTMQPAPKKIIATPPPANVVVSTPIPTIAVQNSTKEGTASGKSVSPTPRLTPSAK